MEPLKEFFQGVAEIDPQQLHLTLPWIYFPVYRGKDGKRKMKTKGRSSKIKLLNQDRYYNPPWFDWKYGKRK